MEYNKLKFGKLLEQYVFSVTIRVIDLVDSETQTKLIRLFNSINKGLPAIVQRSKAEIKAIERLITIHQLTIETTLAYISRVDTLVEKAKRTNLDTVKNNNLIASYLSLKDRYSVALINVQALQQKDISSIKEQ